MVSLLFYGFKGSSRLFEHELLDCLWLTRRNWRAGCGWIKVVVF